MENNQVEQLKTQLNKLEQQGLDQYMTLLEIMSNATFFGDLKKTSCQHAKNGQCGYYFLQSMAEERIPIATPCRIQKCKHQPHCHLELSNITCALCPQWQNHPEKFKTNTWLTTTKQP